MNDLVQHSPTALRYYMEKMFLSTADLARKTGIAPSKVELATQQDLVFKYSQLEKVASKLTVPPVYLTVDKIYSFEIPEAVDYRSNHNFSLQCYEYQNFLREVLLARENNIYVLECLGEEPQGLSLDLSGKDAKSDAEKVSNFLGVTRDNIKQNNSDDYYLAWRRLVESKDILVIDRDRLKFDADGMALFYEASPVIVIFGSGQAPERKLFTLIHELVHLGLRQSACDGGMLHSHHAIEKYCNAVAGHVLAPESEIKKLWVNGLAFPDQVKNIRKKIKVSHLVIAIQCYLTGRIDKQTFDDYQKIRAIAAAARLSEDGRAFSPPKHITTINRFGRSYVQNVFTAVWENTLSVSVARQILGYKDESLQQLQERAFS